MKKSFAAGLTCLAVFVACCTALKAAATVSVWDGVYTQEQATRGQAQFASHCASCHGTALDGSDMAPPLAGKEVLYKWSGEQVADLVDVINTTMPSDNPGSLDPKTVVDIAAYILSVNQFPAGTTELPDDPAALRTISIDATKPGGN